MWIRVALLARRDHPEEVGAQQRRLSPADPKGLGRGRNQGNQPKVLSDHLGVVDVLGRLRAHEAIAVAAVGGEDRVVRRADPIQAPDEPLLEVQPQDVAFLDVLHLMSLMDGGQS
jgi:hypothetical protein